MSKRNGRRRVARGWVALIVASLSAALLLIMWPTVTGNGAFAADDSALILAVFGFGAAVIAGIVGLVLAVTAVITDRGRKPGIAAAALAATEPILAAGISSVFTA